MANERTQAVEHDLFDAETFAEARGEFAKLEESARKYADKLLTAPELLQDVFLSLYQPAPQLAPADAMAPTHRPNRGMVAESMETREFSDLRAAGTVNDRMGAAFATDVIAGKLIGALSAIDRENINDLAKMTAEAGQLLAEAALFDEYGATYNRPDLLADAQSRRDEAAELQAHIDNCAVALDETADERADAVRRAFRTGAADVAAQLDELNTAIDAFSTGPGYAPGAGRSTMTSAAKLALARRLRRSPRLAQLAQIIGRYVNIALSVQRARLEHIPSEIATVTRGNDLAHVLPSELALLADPLTEDVFYHRFGERALQQYQLHTNDKIGRGPIVVALDESASMLAALGADGTTREVWSKAIAVALLSLARRQRRDFALIRFSSAAELATVVFPRGEATPSQAIAAVDHFYGGGTSYAGWMTKALELVNGARFGKADVVLLSDGEAAIPNAGAWQKARRDKGMRAYGVMLGATAPPARPAAPDPNTASAAEMIAYIERGTGGAATLAAITDQLFYIDDLAAEGDALRTLFAV